MISVSKAKNILKKHSICITKTEKIFLADAQRRILAENLYTPFDYPPFDNSAMDGFVFNLNDIKNKTPHDYFDIKGEVVAGGLQKELPRPHTMRIFTGAVIPRGANCVIPVEDCHVQGKKVKLKIEKSQIKIKQHIRKRALSFSKGETLLKKGSVLQSMNIALLASFGYKTVKAYKKLKLSIGITGDELVRKGKKLRQGQIYESNGVFLSQLCTQHGFDVVNIQHLQDTKEATEKFLLQKKSDVVLTSGGISMGDKDFVRIVLKNQKKFETIFQKVSIKPGKPFTFAYLKKTKTPILCMPGNPLSVFIIFIYFILPYLLKLAGGTDSDLMFEELPSPKKLPQNNRMQFLFAKKIGKTVDVFSEQGSSAIKNLSNADGACIVKENAEIVKGDNILYFPFNQFFRPM